jgi:hypothetical protein
MLLYMGLEGLTTEKCLPNNNNNNNPYIYTYYI